MSDGRSRRFTRAPHLARHLHPIVRLLGQHHLVQCIVEPSILQGTPSDTTRAFSRLSRVDRQCLDEWLHDARTTGIDSVEDPTSRPWPHPVTGTVIGVFQTGSQSASWLVIGHNGAWVVARCAEGTVSRTCGSLANALAVIHPAQPDGGEHRLLC